ncbi:MAG: iron ABC transporter permease, partial [Psychrobacter sp.]|nr:iron ABC transporter permease [Psychrobacter sp.]
MITTPDASVSQNDPDNNNVNGSVIDNQTVSQDHTVRKRIISKSVLGLISLFMLVPILVVLLSWTQPVADIWTHMKDYVLPQVLKNTAILLLMVTVISGTVGTTLAWVTSMYRFPGQRFFSWALMLPL